MAEIQSVRSAGAPYEGDIVFVHGLKGDISGTWHSGPTGGYWPAWIQDEFPELRVWSIGYEAALFGDAAMFFQDRALNLLDLLATKDIGRKPVFVIAHSLGGIVAKQMLRTAERVERFRPLLHSVKGFAFLATPHFGSDLAALIKALGLPSRLGGQLESDDSVLRELNEWFCGAAAQYGIKTRAYAENKKVHGMVFVVSRASAHPHTPGCELLVMDSDHLSICKPASRDDHIHRSVVLFVRDVHNQLTPEDLPGAADPFSTPLRIEVRRFLQQARLAGHVRSTGEPIYLDAVYVKRSEIEGQLRKLVDRYTRGSADDAMWIGIEGDAGSGKSSILWALHLQLQLLGDVLVLPFGAQLASDGFQRERQWVEEIRTKCPKHGLIILIDTIDLIVGSHDKSLIDFITWVRALGCLVITTSRVQEAQALAAFSPPDFRLPLGRYTVPEAYAAVQNYTRVAYPAYTDEQFGAQVERVWGLLDQRRSVQELNFDPLILRMLFEVYAPDPIPQDVNTQQVYRAFWEERVLRITSVRVVTMIYSCEASSPG